MILFPRAMRRLAGTRRDAHNSASLSRHLIIPFCLGRLADQAQGSISGLHSPSSLLLTDDHHTLLYPTHNSATYLPRLQEILKQDVWQ
jgi:hypothetical protein